MVGGNGNLPIIKGLICHCCMKAFWFSVPGGNIPGMKGGGGGNLGTVELPSPPWGIWKSGKLGGRLIIGGAKGNPLFNKGFAMLAGACGLG